MRTIAVVGVGLIGGSFALAMRKAGFTGTVLGVSSPATLEAALRNGVIDEGATLADAARRSDLLYLAAPIYRIAESFAVINAEAQASALVTDAGSTKEWIVGQAEAAFTRCQFLGGHPVAGKETRGVESADAELFRGRSYVLTPRDPSAMETPAAQQFLGWLVRMGARPVLLDPCSHDRTLAYTSHLPQLLSTALASFLAGQDGVERQVFGPGLIDSTRLAQSPFDIWADILRSNSREIHTALAGFIEFLERMNGQLTSDELALSFKQAADFSRDLRKNR